jgi:hypothetical protein
MLPTLPALRSVTVCLVWEHWTYKPSTGLCPTVLESLPSLLASKPESGHFLADWMQFLPDSPAVQWCIEMCCNFRRRLRFALLSIEEHKSSWPLLEETLVQFDAKIVLRDGERRWLFQDASGSTNKIKVLHRKL